MFSVLRSYRLEAIWLVALLAIAGAYQFSPTVSAQAANCHYDQAQNWCFQHPVYDCLCDI